MEKYSLQEIIDMTLEKEKMRRDFYLEAAKRFNKQIIKDLFLELSEWEAMHVQKVDELKSKLEGTELIESYAGDLQAYFRSVVDSELYEASSMEDFVKGIKDEKEAIDWAISFEKDAVLFFNEFLALSNLSERGMIEKLRDEEKNHIMYLARLKENLKKE